ncbi:hypothetical protein BpHYR1_040093 [Brachionus plicatilis]|uniref:Uncharacterized protein n=1 Tax=Brachionus plicatilis TaxID=10195 RepID=A0A3M7PHM0_BRAPC|nr:hypothetical protein BpHYR1_040093 [Brachionus plicatilis]
MNFNLNQNFYNFDHLIMIMNFKLPYSFKTELKKYTRKILKFNQLQNDLNSEQDTENN